MHDRSRIQAALAPLVGLPLWASNRAADMQTFQLGAKHTRISQFGSRKGQASIVGDYALHLQCAWHVVGPTGVLVRADDELARRDELIAAWLTAREYLVASVRADAHLGFTLELADSHALHVFPSSDNSEQWRLLRPRAAETHFVVLGSGIEED